MAFLANSFLRDPALVAMGLVPGNGMAGGGASRPDHKALRWRTAWIGLALAVAALIGLFRQTAGGMVETWQSSATFNHAFLVPPICIYLIWVCREKLAARAPEPSLWGIVLVAVMGFGWLIGSIASANAVQQFALIGMIEGLVLTVLGWRVVLAIVFPLFYLVLAVPFGEFLVPPLQDLTAAFVVEALRLIGVPVFFEGVFLTIPNAKFEVAEACSGVRFLIATVTLGLLFTFLFHRPFSRRALFVGLSFVVPIIANGFRALGIVLVAYYWDSRAAVGVDHIVYGWIFFSFVTIVLLSLGIWLREKTPAKESAGPRPPATSRDVQGSFSIIAVMAVLGLATAAAAPAYERFSRPDAPAQATVKLMFPHVGGGWEPAGSGRSAWRPLFPSADARLLGTYVKNGKKVQFFIAYYARQTQGKEVIHNGNKIADERFWQRMADRTATMEIDGHPTDVRVMRMLRGDRRRLALSWYWVGGAYTSSPYVAKLLQIRSGLFGGAGAAAAIAVSTSYDERPREAEELLQDFFRHTASVRQALERASRN